MIMIIEEAGGEPQAVTTFVTMTEARQHLIEQAVRPDFQAENYRVVEYVRVFNVNSVLRGAEY
jgi:hypothetical protein